MFRTLFCAIAILFCSEFLFAQTEGAPFKSGAFQVQSESMRKLIRLKLKNRSIVLRRNWPTDSADKKQNRIDSEIEKMLGRGIDRAMAAKLAEKMTGFGVNMVPVEHCFFDVAGTMPSSFSTSGGGGSRKLTFRGETLNGRAEFAGEHMAFHFSERRSLKRELSIVSSGTKLQIKYTGDDYYLDYKQSEKTGVRLTRVIDEKTDVFSATDFIELRTKNFELFDNWLMPLFDHLGFEPPLLMNHPTVKKAAIAKIQDLSSATPEFEMVIADLDSDDFSVRNQASEIIVQNRIPWKVMIEAKVGSPNLSLEARERLKGAMSDPGDEALADQTIREQELLTSPEFLISLLDFAPDQADLVMQRLKIATGESHADVVAWKKWWQQKNRSK